MFGVVPAFRIRPTETGAAVTTDGGARSAGLASDDDAVVAEQPPMGQESCSRGMLSSTIPTIPRQPKCVLTQATLGVACVTANSQEERAPAWSPDGTGIAFMCRNPANNFFGICVMNADGTGKTRLTNNSVCCQSRVSTLFRLCTP